MAKLTTEEFIAKAKAVHGDRYDYSKVEYVNNQTKVCIICKKHGEFWQTPKSHLNSNGCHMCSGLRTWNYETCYEEAKKYKSRGEFHKMCPCGYSAARKNNWMNDYTWYPIRKRVPNGYWTYESCFEEAKKYKTRAEFHKGSAGAYIKAWRKGWIKDYDWMPSRQTKPAGYWDNYDHCYEEAKKYKSRRSFQRGCIGGYTKALRNGWLNDYNWFSGNKRNGFWNKETCYEEARKYDNITAFAKNAVRAYPLSRLNGWFSEYTWFKKLTKSWDYETCKAEAVKYNNRMQFRAGASGAYTKSRINGWLDDFYPKKH